MGRPGRPPGARPGRGRVGKKAWFKAHGARVTLFSTGDRVTLDVSGFRTRVSGQSGPDLYTAKCYPALNQAQKPANRRAELPQVLPWTGFIHATTPQEGQIFAGGSPS